MHPISFYNSIITKIIKKQKLNEQELKDFNVYIEKYIKSINDALNKNKALESFKKISNHDENLNLLLTKVQI